MNSMMFLVVLCLAIATAYAGYALGGYGGLRHGYGLGYGGLGYSGLGYSRVGYGGYGLGYGHYGGYGHGLGHIGGFYG